MQAFTPTQFRKDIKRGEAFENFVADYFKQRGWAVKRAKGNCPAYDLVLTRDRSSVFVECKYDEKSDTTGNYCLEKASLEHTQSSILIIGTKAVAYALPMDSARQLYNTYPKRMLGDLPNNWCALVPKSIFSNYQRL